MEQQQNKDDNLEHANFTCTLQIVTTTDTIDSVDIVKLDNENDSSSPSSSEDEVSEEKNCSTLTDVVLIQSPVLGEDRNRECNDIVMNVEEKAGYSAQPTPFETQSDIKRKNRAPRYFEPCYESDKSSDEDKKRRKRKKRKIRKRCYNCGDTSHHGPECKRFTACLICSQKGHLIKDCRQINIEMDSTSRLCIKCGNEGHDMFTCNTNYISEDLKEIQCYVCKEFGHLCCVEYKTDEPTEVSCYKCGESGHFGSVCSMVEPILEDPEIFCKKCTRKRLFRNRRPCRKCNKARKKAKAAAASVEATTEKVATAELESANGKKSLKHSREEKRLTRIPTVNNVRPIRHKAIWLLPIPPVFGPYYGRPGSNVWLNPALAAARNGQNKPQYATLKWTHQPVTETSRQPLNWTCQPVTETSQHPLNWTCQPVTETSRQPLNWTHQPVTEASQQPLNWTCQPVTEASQQPLNWTCQPVTETSRQPLNWTHQPVTEAFQQPLNWTCQPVTETSQDPAKPFYPFMHSPHQTNIQKETENIIEMVLPKQSSSHQITVPLPCRNSNNETINQNSTGSPSLSATDPLNFFSGMLDSGVE